MSHVTTGGRAPRVHSPLALKTSWVTSRLPRVFLGPVNIAGFLWEYAEGLRELGCEARVVACGGNRYGYTHDADFEPVRGVSLGDASRLRAIASHIAGFDVFHFAYGMTLLPRHLDLPILRALGKIVVMQFFGSDIRCGRYERGVPYDAGGPACSACRGAECRGADRVRGIRRMLPWVNAFISIPDASFADQLPPSRTTAAAFLAIDAATWSPLPDWQPNGVPRILHAPSSAAVKGTAVLLETLDRLRAEGESFDFQLVEQATNQEVRRALREADIVVDQLLSATNGRLAIEAMAVGKPVLCSLSDDYVRDNPGLPIVRTSPASLADDLRRLIRDQGFRLQVGARGRTYVEQHYARAVVGRRLLDLYRRAGEHRQ